MNAKHLGLVTMLAAVTSLSAALESVGIDVTVEPVLPAVLRMEGLRNGRVVVAVSVDAQGQLSDSLVIAASHRELIRPCLEAVRQWRFTPARIDGEAVGVCLEVGIEISQEGAVVSRTPSEMIGDFMERVVGRPYDYRACPASAVDRPPVALTQVSPVYALQALQQGIGGQVRVTFYIDERGTVRLPVVPADVHPYLASAAVDALRGWKFAPPTQNGQPVLVAAQQTFFFGGASK